MPPFEETWSELLPAISDGALAEWRRDRGWRAEIKAKRARGEKLPSEIHSTMRRCVCGAMFDEWNARRELRIAVTSTPRRLKGAGQSWRPVPKYYFDHHDSAGVEIDDEGIDLTSIDAARTLAFEALGQWILDGRRTGRVAIEVRDQIGPILRASAVIVLEQL